MCRSKSLVSVPEFTKLFWADLPALRQSVKGETILSKDALHPQHKERRVSCYYELHLWEHSYQVRKDFVLVDCVQMKINLVHHSDPTYIACIRECRPCQIKIPKNRQE